MNKELHSAMLEIYTIIDIEDYFQRFDAFEELLRKMGYEA